MQIADIFTKALAAPLFMKLRSLIMGWHGNVTSESLKREYNNNIIELEQIANMPDPKVTNGSINGLMDNGLMGNGYMVESLAKDSFNDSKDCQC
jgi:hypothetical protein